MERRAAIRSGVLWTLVVAWAIVIFLFSAQDAAASTQLSDKITEIVIEILAPNIPVISPAPQVSIWASFIRNVGHFASFGIFGVLNALAMRSHRPVEWKNWLFPAGICLIYAITDEIHQLFVPGRSMQFSDICIDFAGSIVGIAFIAAVAAMIRAVQAKQTAKTAE